MNHFTTITVVTSVAATFGIANAHAASRRVDYSQGDINDSIIVKTDYHVVISSDTGMDYIGASLDDGNACIVPSRVSGSGTSQLVIDWDTLVIQPDQNIGVDVSFRQNEENAYTVSKYFTPQDGVSPALGLRVTSDGTVYLTNAYASSISFTNGQFVIQDTPLPLTGCEKAEMMRTVSTGAPFPYTWTPFAPGTVALQSETPVLDLAITEGQYFYAFFENAFDSDPTYVTYDMLGHEHQASAAAIPTLSHWSVVVMILLLIVAGTYMAARGWHQPNSNTV